MWSKLIHDLTGGAITFLQEQVDFDNLPPLISEIIF